LTDNDDESVDEDEKGFLTALNVVVFRYRAGAWLASPVHVVLSKSKLVFRYVFDPLFEGFLLIVVDSHSI
jgi:hypothetical protein